MGIDALAAGYAATVALGGVVGYVKAGSIPSLTAGLVCGTLLGYGCYQVSMDSGNYFLILAVSSLLTGVMGARFYKSRKFMPAGLITVLSLGMVSRYGVRYIATYLQ